MFTGIIEAVGKVEKVKREGGNLLVYISAPFLNELQVDQSVAHNGVCLTVDEISDAHYRCTIIKESLERSNLGDLTSGSVVNLERCTQVGGRLDGHIVQGHVDTTAKCTEVEEVDGSWNYHFQLDKNPEGLIVEKGSITVNGVSLTVSSVSNNEFIVSIIPYTYAHTNFRALKLGEIANIEFDVIGKYVESILQARQH